MKRINVNTIIFLLVGIIIGLSVALVTVVVFKNDKETVIIDNTNNTQNEKIIEKEKEETINNTNTNNKIIKNTNQIDNSNPIEYFTTINNSKDKNTIKQGFIKIVDFLFYDEPINGVRFSELKDDAKLKIIKIALSIDEKIDYYFPGYKETISTGTKRIYKDVKLKIAELYIKVTTKICNNNEQLCIDAKEDFESLKNSFGLTIDFLKDIGKDEFNKLKEWYENFREQ